MNSKWFLGNQIVPVKCRISTVSGEIYVGYLKHAASSGHDVFEVYEGPGDPCPNYNGIGLSAIVLKASSIRQADS